MCVRVCSGSENCVCVCVCVVIVRVVCVCVCVVLVVKGRKQEGRPFEIIWMTAEFWSECEYCVV